MRITLEAADLIGILEKHLETVLDPTQVVVRSDPFEVEVSGIPFVSTPEPPRTEEARYVPRAHDEEGEEETPPRYLPNALKDPPPPGLDTEFSPHEFLVASQRLAAELDAERAQRGASGDNE